MELAAVTGAQLAQQGTVSEGTTLALAKGIRHRLGADWGLAVTGNAGPDLDPGAPEVPVGTFFIAVDGPGGASCSRYAFPTDRAGVQLRCAGWAMDFLRRRILQAGP